MCISAKLFHVHCQAWWWKVYNLGLYILKEGQLPPPFKKNLILTPLLTKIKKSSLSIAKITNTLKYIFLIFSVVMDFHFDFLICHLSRIFYPRPPHKLF